MHDDGAALTVGQFAKLTGLTAHALRHYDEVELLRPRAVDPDTGYRRYGRDQLAAARLIKDLRWLDLPIRQVRDVVADPESPAAHAALADHADRLRRQSRHLARQLDQTTRYANQGVEMPVTTTQLTPVQIKLGVSDPPKARTFYREAFGLSETTVRHTDEEDFGGYQFGEYGQPGFFLIFLLGPDSFDQPGRSTVGFTVPDLDSAHRRALDAGASEAVAINSPQGMPRNSAVTDPDGNWIWLYQG